MCAGGGCCGISFARGVQVVHHTCMVCPWGDNFAVVVKRGRSELEIAVLLEFANNNSIVTLRAHVPGGGDGRKYGLVLDWLDAETPTAKATPIMGLCFLRNSLEALLCLHSAGYVHRDVKTGCMLFDWGLVRWRLVDFDLVGRMDANGTARGGGIGTRVCAISLQ
eukprot:Opistho-2@93471